MVQILIVTVKRSGTYEAVTPKWSVFQILVVTVDIEVVIYEAMTQSGRSVFKVAIRALSGVLTEANILIVVDW